VGEDEEGGDSESSERRVPSTALRTGIEVPPGTAVCDTSIRILGGAIGDRDVAGCVTPVSIEGPAQMELKCQLAYRFQY
jgi:hypothetical protein